MADFLVRPATSGQAALPDLILLDLAMPVMDGFEICRCLKANPATKDVPVIFLTGQGEIEKVVQGFELGVAGLAPISNSTSSNAASRAK